MPHYCFLFHSRFFTFGFICGFQIAGVRAAGKRLAIARGVHTLGNVRLVLSKYGLQNGSAIKSPLGRLTILLVQVELIRPTRANNRLDSDRE